MNPVCAASCPCVLLLHLWNQEGVIPCCQGRPEIMAYSMGRCKGEWVWRRGGAEV